MLLEGKLSSVSFEVPLFVTSAYTGSSTSKLTSTNSAGGASERSAGLSELSSLAGEREPDMLGKASTSPPSHASSEGTKLLLSMEARSSTGDCLLARGDEDSLYRDDKVKKKPEKQFAAMTVTFKRWCSDTLKQHKKIYTQYT